MRYGYSRLTATGASVATERRYCLDNARALLRQRGIDPRAATFEQALEIVQEQEARNISTIWAHNASASQLVLGRREWNRRNREARE
jgi:hypothetical protein